MMTRGKEFDLLAYLAEQANELGEVNELNGENRIPSLKKLSKEIGVSIASLREQLGVARTTIYRWVTKGEFPAPVRIGANAVRWRVADIDG